jgi:hypothetical protein
VAGNSKSNFASSDFDVRNALTAGMTLDLPAPGATAMLRDVLSGWSLQTLLVARSAPPVNVVDVNFFDLAGGNYTGIRPDIVPGQSFYLFGSQFPGGKAFNPNAFTDPPTDSSGYPVRQGDLGRNALRAFGATQWDFAIHRDFSLYESCKLQFRAEMFNILNHPNFGPPDNQFGTGGFGVSTQTLNQSLASAGQGTGGVSALYQIGGPRSIQLALKLFF